MELHYIPNAHGLRHKNAVTKQVIRATCLHCFLQISDSRETGNNGNITLIKANLCESCISLLKG